jgi:hypothetical protein
MKVFNLTDVETPQLLQRSFINQTLVVGRTAIKPGESADFNDEPHLVAQIEGYIELGAMARDELPAEYAVAKARQPAAATGSSNLPIEGTPPAGETSVPPVPLDDDFKKKGRRG